MKSNKLLLLLILTETFTLFCLGVLGNRVADLFNLPTPLLLGFCALGIAVTAIVTFIRQNPTTDSSQATNLSWGEIWQRLKPRRPHKYMFKSDSEIRADNRLVAMTVIGALGFGVFGSFLRLPLIAANLSTYWYALLLVFALLNIIPTLLLLFRETSSIDWGDIVFGGGCLALFFGILVLVGVAIGSLAIYLGLRAWEVIR
jgi:hypothetical protein